VARVELGREGKPSGKITFPISENGVVVVVEGKL